MKTNEHLTKLCLIKQFIFKKRIYEKVFFSFQKLQRKDYKSLLIQIQQFFTGLMLQFIHVKRFEFMV